jgi:CRP-like cAMP-binding protein
MTRPGKSSPFNQLTGQLYSMPDYHQYLLNHVRKHVTLSSEEAELLCSSFKLTRLLKRQYLLQADTVCHYENFIVEGCLRMFHVDDKGVEHTMSFAIEDWWITDLESLLQRTPSAYHIEALENAIVLQLPAASLTALYEKIPALDRYFRILHQNAFIAQSKRILQNISLSGEEKYKSFQASYPQWHQRIPQKHIASYLGITPVFLSQIRKQLSLGDRSH